MARDVHKEIGMDFCEVEPRRVAEQPPWANAWTFAPLRWVQFFPPTRIEWTRLRLPIANLPRGFDGLRILHLSDLHLKTRWPAAYDGLLDRIGQHPPDLLLFTGDFVDNKYDHRPALPLVRRMVEGWAARAGRFAIHGNHDSYAIGAALRDTGVRFIDGQREILRLPGGGLIELIGLPGRRRLELSPRFLRSIPARNPATVRVVLSHFPDHLRRASSLKADIFLAGHTHGGQVCFPTGRPILTHDALPPPLATGAHRVADTWLVVNRGLGYTGLPIRAFCTPEVVEITLTEKIEDRG
ncbi:MAG: phosphoesterase [Phycisphaerales bacterium]|nr:phosphoesterase [Phycisphaerales bacterium]